MIKDIVYKIWNIFISLIKFILYLISIIATIGVTFIFGLAIYMGINPSFLSCTGTAFNFVVLGLFILAGIFIIGIVAGVLGKDEEEIKEDIDNKK